jgi:hypothetical protein
MQLLFTGEKMATWLHTEEETSTSAQITCVTIACKSQGAEAAEELYNELTTLQSKQIVPSVN